jgi:hypothetical protein
MPCILPGGKYGCKEQYCLKNISPYKILDIVVKYIKDV